MSQSEHMVVIKAHKKTPFHQPFEGNIAILKFKDKNQHVHLPVCDE